MKPETKFRVKTVKPFLELLKNVHPFPIQQLGINGTPDFLLCCYGKFVALELKSMEGELSTLQAYNLWRVLQTGGLSFVANPETWKNIKEIFIKLNKGEKLNATESTYCNDEIRRHLKL